MAKDAFTNELETLRKDVTRVLAEAFRAPAAPTGKSI